MARPLRRILVLLALGVLAFPAAAIAEGKVSLYLLRMDPSDVDARRFSRTSWGGGLAAVLPAPALHNLLAATAGIEIANMMSHRTTVYDSVLRENLEQSTDQSYGRFFVGGRVGPHGPGFLRPHAGLNLAVVWYGISTDIKIPDPEDDTHEITKNLRSDYRGAFGYDVNAGLDVNFGNRVPLEIGVRHVQSFNVPQALGEGSVSVSPAYFEAYFAVGLGLSVMR